MSYTELQVTTNFSFLRGASHPEEFVDQAIKYGYHELAITDRNSLAGIVRAYAAAKNKGLRIITGRRLNLIDGVSLLAYPTNKEAYAQLCQLLSKGNLRTEKEKCDLYKADVYAHMDCSLKKLQRRVATQTHFILGNILVSIFFTFPDK